MARDTMRKVDVYVGDELAYQGTTVLVRDDDLKVRERQAGKPTYTPLHLRNLERQPCTKIGLDTHCRYRGEDADGLLVEIVVVKGDCGCSK